MNITPTDRKSLEAACPGLLRAVGAARRLMAAERIVWSAAWQGLLVTAIIIIAAAWDIAWHWPEWARLLLFAVVACGAIRWAAWAVWFWDHGVSDSQAARRLEETHGIGGDRLVSPVELLKSSGMSSAMIRIGVSEAEELSAGLVALRVVRRATWRRAGVVGAMALLWLGVVAWRMPGVVGATLDRFARSWEDHPAYTRIRFDVHAETSGITARTSGEPVATADVVWVGDDGVETRSPMMRRVGPAGSEEFGLDLASEPEAGAFYIDTPGGRSERMSIAGASHGNQKRQAGTAQGVSPTKPIANATGASGGGSGSGSGSSSRSDGPASNGVPTGASGKTGEPEPKRDGEESSGIIRGTATIEGGPTAATRKGETDPGKGDLRDVPARYRWLAERYRDRQ